MIFYGRFPRFARVGLSGVPPFGFIPSLRFGTRLRRAPTIPNAKYYGSFVKKCV